MSSNSNRIAAVSQMRINNYIGVIVTKNALIDPVTLSFDLSTPKSQYFQDFPRFIPYTKFEHYGIICCLVIFRTNKLTLYPVHLHRRQLQAYSVGFGKYILKRHKFVNSEAHVSGTYISIITQQHRHSGALLSLRSSSSQLDLVLAAKRSAD